MEKRRRLNDVKELPSDVWIEILRRIPAADLFPLRAVCKTFRRLISDDLFTRLHLNHFTKLHPKANRSIIISPSHSKYDPDKRTISVWHDEPSFGDWRDHGYRVIDSYHGVLLVTARDRLFLCNPITKSYKFVPGNFSSVCWKIVYDDVSEQYRVYGLGVSGNKVSLYVLDDVHRDGEPDHHLPREFTIMKADPDDDAYDLIKQSVFVDGNVYWLIIAKRAKPLDAEIICAYIVSANLTTKMVKTRIIGTPFAVNPESDNFFAANGTFYLGRSIYRMYELQLWVLRGVESENPNPSWMRIKDRIKYTRLTLRSPLPHRVRALGMFRDKLLVVVMSTQQYYQYDLRTKEFAKVTLATGDHIERGMKSFEYFRIVEHIDSLISLRTFNGVVRV